MAVTDPKRAPVGPAFVESQLELLEPRRDRTRLVHRFRLVPSALHVALLDLFDERRGGSLGQTARQEEVACVAARNVDHFAAQSEMVDVLLEDDFHRHVAYFSPMYGRGDLARALHGDRNLALVAPARTADAAGADLPLSET